MPIRVPQILAQTTPELGPAPHADPGALGAFAVAPYRGLADVATTIQHAADQYLHVQQQLTAQDMKLDVEDKLTQVRDRLAQEDVALRQEGVDPDQMAEVFRQRGTRAISEVAKDLRYPQSAARFQADATKALGGEVIKQRYEGLKLKYARIGVLAEVANQQDVNAAVFGATPEEQQAALGRIDARLFGPRGLVPTGVWSQDKAESVVKDVRSQIQEGRATRDFQRPELATTTILTLRRGEWLGLSPERQFNLADKLEQHQRAEMTRQKTEIKAAQDERAQAAEKDIEDLTLARSFAGARARLAEARRDIPASQYSHWQDTITKRETGQIVSDPATYRRLKLSVYSATGNAMEAAADVKANIDSLSDEHYRQLATHAETRVNRGLDKGQATLQVQHAQAEQMLQESLRVTGPAAAILNTQAQDLYVMGLEDLSRNSRYLEQGSEMPLEWYERRKAFYMGRLGTVASQRLKDIQGQLVLGNGVRYGTGNWAQDVETLKQARGSFRVEADFYDQVRMLRDAQALEAERVRLMVPTGGSPGGAPTHKTAPTAPGPTLGRSQGK